MTNQTPKSRYRGLWLLPMAALLMLAACTSTSGAGESEEDIGPPVSLSMAIEMPGETYVQPPFVVSGWALDEAAEGDPGINKVQILDHGCEGDVIGVAEFGATRSDIGLRYGDQAEDSGWQFEVTRIHTGERTLAVRVFADGSAEYDACETLPIIVEETLN